MSSPNDPLVWVAIAEEDFAIAQSALRRKHPFTYSACFHAQQCAEKYLKALLISRKQKFSKVHDLLVLNNQCAAVGILLGMDTTQLDTLSGYGVRARYPDDILTVEEARKAVETAKAVRRFARKFLSLK